LGETVQEVNICDGDEQEEARWDMGTELAELFSGNEEPIEQVDAKRDDQQQEHFYKTSVCYYSHATSPNFDDLKSPKIIATALFIAQELVACLRQSNVRCPPAPFLDA